MTFHAVRTTLSTPSVAVLVYLLLVLAIAVSSPVRAATLGVVTDIDRRAGELGIDGQTYKVDSFSEIKQKNTAGADETAAWFSLNVGDYVIFDASNGRITTLRRETGDSLDRPPGRPLDLNGLNGRTPRER